MIQRRPRSRLAFKRLLGLRLVLTGANKARHSSRRAESQSVGSDRFVSYPETTLPQNGLFLGDSQK